MSGDHEMQLGAPSGPGPVAHDVAAAIRDGAARLGHRPAITQLLIDGRQEQSGASLAQWAAKGAHFLEVDLVLRPGDRLHLAAPVGWTTAAVALAAWWAGMAVTLTPDPDVEVTVAHASHADAVPAGTEVLWLGDGIDGAPIGPLPLGRGEPWVRAVQPFPDQPPPSRAAPEAIAVADGDRVTTQRELLRLATDLGGDGTLGLDGTGGDATRDLALLCLRPLWCGRPTLVARELPRSAAEGDRVTVWR
jgi:uncharacterized protein (TIGR03089 family)